MINGSCKYPADKSIGYHHPLFIQKPRFLMTILFISGVNDLSTVPVLADPDGNLFPVLDGNCPILGRVPLRQEGAAYLTLFGKSVKQAQVNFAKKPSLVINQITNADTHSGALERCEELIRQADAPVLNRPDEVLQSTPDRVFEKLQGVAGLVVPRTIRCQPHSPADVFAQAEAAGIGFPFIVRAASAHAGDDAGRVLVRNPNQQDRLDVFPMDGRDFYVTEFVDYQESSGLYNKQKLLVIDGEPVLREFLFRDTWCVDRSSREFMLTRETGAEIEARAAWFETDVLPALADRVAEITRRLNLEFYTIGCNVRPDGTMIVFHAGPDPDVLELRNRHESQRMKMIHQKIQGMLARRSGEVVV